MPKRAPGDGLMHTRYIMWASKTVAAANRHWKAHEGFGELFTRSALHWHLFAWAEEEGLIKPEKPLCHSPSFHAARAFNTHQPLVVEEARAWWKERYKEARALARQA